MDKRKEANLRVKRNIVRALIELMQKKNYSDISVSEITALAGVSRISYYRNYDSKEDILTESLESLMTHFSEEINPLPLHTPSRRVMSRFFHVAREEKDHFMLLHQAGMDSQLQNGLDEFILSCPHFPSLDRRRTYPAYLFSGALFRLLIRWYDNDMNENDTELANIFCQYMDGLL
ncbi:TetR/AcrR family transcriptional regulator [Frisingicoccus sp.]|uniref:TetR/AcrR family transcriptional regulator n=1 Tax=Frisingicoccus sp. TaxID=1918627 RepID=UPI0026052691|nr:TetR/AcrR family transcriptional regulator [Frisingicoccus sp.]MDD6233393.1 TetR/AcrR family transcriptional regulator [Frisingicoccus sp.]MDD6233394.1 TetR/AcrR family transcriptional regulator [Frisingicoccus sp.]MDY4834922.1 TetR/AcrR family transcriptional regulator [Frisingicoccus sp.]MDY4921629.1 TetR/AcrR family transcriptional regulator [Frisingicoccus sp.]